MNIQQTQLYLLVGSVLWGYLSLVFFEVAFAIGWERWEGTIEYTFMAPVRKRGRGRRCQNSDRVRFRITGHRIPPAI